MIEDGKTVKVQMHDETQYDADIVGSDSRTDIGVLRIRANGFTAAQFGNSDSLSVGETVYAIGNPGGVAFAGSFTNGMVSAISRPVDSQIGYEMLCIQHTAAINPGNSGGALVNAYGQVIGINSSKIASTEYEGMGFAVPSVTVKEVFDEIVRNEVVQARQQLFPGIFQSNVQYDCRRKSVARRHNRDSVRDHRQPACKHRSTAGRYDCKGQRRTAGFYGYTARFD